MALKSKFERIDQSKLKQGARDVLAKMKDKSENFTNAEVNKKIEPAIDKLIERLKKENPDALKKASATRTRKPKTTAKKKATKKAPAKKGGAKRETVMTVAKRIRKDGEKWQDALKRAKSEMGKDTKKKVSAVKTEVDKLKKLIEKDAVLKGFSNSELQRDAVRKAKPRGKRKTTTKGETTNQYGTYKNKVGRTYWESRENRSDRYAPKYPKNKPFLEMGGDVTDAQDLSMANADFLVMAKGGNLKIGENVTITRKDGKKYKGKIEKINPIKIRTSPTELVVLPNYAIDKIEYAKGGEIDGRYKVLLEKRDNSGKLYPPNLYWKGNDKNLIAEKVKEAKKDFPTREVFVTDEVGDREIYNYAKGGEIDAFTMSMVKGVDDGVSEIETKDLKARMEKGGITARGKSGRYHILGESPSAKKPFFYASTDDRASIKSLVSDAKKDFKDLGATNVKVFVTDEKEDRRIFENQYAKGGSVEDEINYIVELRYIGLPINESMIGKPVMSEETLDRLEDEFKQDITFTPIDETKMKPLSYDDSRKFILDFDRNFKNGLLGVRGYYAKGGMIEYSKDGIVKVVRNIDGKILKEINVKGVTYRRNPIYKTYNSVKNNELLTKEDYAKGGEIDLFEDYEKQPKELAEIVEVYEERYADGDMDYESTKEFLDKVNAIGYTFDAGLDNEPYNLRPMMAKGGEVNEAYIDYMNKDKGFKTDRKYFKTYEDAEKWARNEFERFNPDMISYTEYETPLRSFAKGGRLKSALMRDRKYYNKNESWERSYSKSKNRKGYKEEGGQIDMDL